MFNYKPKIISLFAGCGGFDLGFHTQGYETVWANDFDKWACETFKKNLGDVIVREDIEKINPYTDDIPDCDLIIGGFPCQEFSRIGPQGGIATKKGSLYKSFLRFIDAKKPKVFVAENVRGILSIDNYEAIKTIVKDFENIHPSYLVKIHLYNFADYGVPQFRQRVLIVGTRIDTDFEFVHPAPTHGATTSKEYVTTEQALKGVKKVLYNNEHFNITLKTIERLKLIPEGGCFMDTFKNLPRTHPLARKGKVFPVYLHRIHRQKPSHTILTGGDKVYHYLELHALTNRERARLQSFPDSFIFCGAKTHVATQIGNAVPPVGVWELAKAIKPLFKGKYKRTDIRALSTKLQKMSIKDRLNYDKFIKIL